MKNKKAEKQTKYRKKVQIEIADLRAAKAKTINQLRKEFYRDNIKSLKIAIKNAIKNFERASK